MRLKKLELVNFGPFKEYRINFIDEDNVCILLTGKNNEGKSTIINALKFLNAAINVVNNKRQEKRIDNSTFYELYRQDTGNLLKNLPIGRMIFECEDSIAEIKGIFKDGLAITVYLDPNRNLVYASFDGYIPEDIRSIFGFIPVLGPLSEREEIISELRHLKTSLDTSLAPRHLRNHFRSLLTSKDFNEVRKIVNSSWSDIELLKYDIDYSNNKIDCYYKEKRFTREISWAGQGLQIWFQIITHLVRLRNTSILILDEPEINLHPEKQNDLIRIIKEYYDGSVIIATHSVELINNVDVSHIINVQKNQKEPVIKSTENRKYLELVRTQIGSNFNLTASQFEPVDIVIFTEDADDFHIIQSLATSFGITKQAFNIRLHGFSEYDKAPYYKKAYELLIGRKIDWTVVLDRDYYPEEYLRKVKDGLSNQAIKTVYTIGKEIENMFLSPNLLRKLIPQNLQQGFDNLWNSLFDNEEYLECHGSFLTLHEHFIAPRIDIKTISKRYTPVFDKIWNKKTDRYKIIRGTETLSKVRKFYKEKCDANLSWRILTDKLVDYDDGAVKKFVNDIYCI